MKINMINLYQTILNSDLMMPFSEYLSHRLELIINNLYNSHTRYYIHLNYKGHSYNRITFTDRDIITVDVDFENIDVKNLYKSQIVCSNPYETDYLVRTTIYNRYGSIYNKTYVFVDLSDFLKMYNTNKYIRKMKLEKIFE